jgi:integrase
MATDSKMLPELDRLTEATKNKGGRPRVSRDLCLRLFKAKVGGQPTYSIKQIAKMLDCGILTVYRMRDEFIREGTLEPEEKRREASIIEGDFDQECKRATGMSFFEWLKDKYPSGYRTVYHFCEKVWISIWNRPSLVAIKDVDSNDADQVSLTFKNYFSEDKERMRRRLKDIRFLFRFLGRMDVCDRNLTMSNAKHPREIRRVPIIEMKDFPIKLQEVINTLSDEDKTLIMFKLLCQGRTGDAKKERGISGIKKNAGKSYLYMNGIDDYKCHLFEKQSEEWDITFITKEVLERLYQHYLNVKDGDYLFTNLDAVSKRWGEATKNILGQKLILHDLRKISITWYYALGVPLEIATELNVGWKDLNTPKAHYLHMRKLLKKTDKIEYREKIPTWFKDGIEEYTEG